MPRKLPSPDAGIELSRVEAACARVIDHLDRWEPDAQLRTRLSNQLSALGSLLVVRSSATCEDDPRSPSAGVFTSVVGVTDLPGLLTAVRSCWASLWSPVAWAMLRRRRAWPGEEGMGVIIQRLVVARVSGILLTRDPSARDSMRLEAVRGPGHLLADGVCDPWWAVIPTAGPLTADPIDPGSPVDADTVEALRRAGLVASEELASQVELEWVRDDEQVWLVQARPVIEPPAPATEVRWCVPASAGAGVRWRWDREHNPEPLSEAHIGLMSHLEGPGADRSLVLHGYLYVAGSDREPPRERERDALDRVWRRFEVTTLEQIAAEEERCAAKDDAGAAAEQLERALDLFRTFHRRYFGSLAEARRSARAALTRFLRQALGHSAARISSQLTATAANSSLTRMQELFRLSREVRVDPSLARSLVKLHLKQYGHLVSSWDVASPSLAEQPEVLKVRLLSMARVDDDPAGDHAAQAKRARDLAAGLEQRLPGEQRERFRELLGAAMLARQLEEDDDLIFSRALGLVRGQLLRSGRALAGRGWLDRPAQVFLLPHEQILSLLPRDRPPEDLPRRLDSAAETWSARRRLTPPLSVQGDRAFFGTPGSPGAAGTLRGLGIGGVAHGRVHRVTRMEQMLEGDLRGAVVVCPTLLPSLALILPEVAALITDHGGLLSHAACLARELGKVAVVGTGTATRDLQPGDHVWVDGRRGLVIRHG